MKFLNDVRVYLLSKKKIDLPDNFLKRWLLSVNKDKISKEQIEIEYPNYVEGLKLQLIEKDSSVILVKLTYIYCHLELK